MRRLLVLAALTPSFALAQPADDFLWLEEVEGEEALEWVEARNASTLEALQAHPSYDDLYSDALEILTSDERIAYPSIMGDSITNFWTDEANERGLWRRTTWTRYMSGEPEWETLLSVDALNAEEDENWAWKGAACLAPDYERCLVRLSRGGADAVEIREFDLTTRQFVEGGFFLPESKGGAAWMSADELLVSTDFGEGTMTESGYPRVVKRWRRGQPLAEATTVFEGGPTDVGAWAGSIRRGDEIVAAVFHRPSFFEGSTHVLHEDEFVRLDVPMDADPGLVGDHMTLYLRSDYEANGETFASGTLLAINYEAFLGGSRDFDIVLAPTDRQTIQYTATTKDAILVSLLDNVNGELHRFRHDG